MALSKFVQNITTNGGSEESAIVVEDVGMLVHAMNIVASIVVHYFQCCNLLFNDLDLNNLVKPLSTTQFCRFVLRECGDRRWIG